MRKALHLVTLSGIFLLLLACSSTDKKAVVAETPTVPTTTAPDKAPTPTDQLKSEMIKFLEASKPNRGVDQPGHEASFKYLKNEFDNLAEKTPGAKVYVQEFLPDTKFAVQNYKKDFDTQIKGKYPPADPMYIKWKSFTDNAVKFVDRYKKIRGKNIILELPGNVSTETTDSAKDTRALYIGAHYDTITHNHQTMEFTPKEPTPGADDNASGVVALLKLAKHFSKNPHARTLRFVAFDYEEIFFLGSYHLAKSIKNNSAPWKSKNETPYGLINFEMIGYSTRYITDHPKFKIYTNKPLQNNTNGSKEATVGIAGVSSNLGIGSNLAMASELGMARAIRSASEDGGSPYTGSILENGFDRGDNWSFWQNGFLAITVSEDWEQNFNEANYHTNHDTIETINFQFMNAIIESVKQAIVIL